ncbi:unnamed protein product [Rotaria sordida]|uniref:Protein tyrosine phosphatase n=1 Tax=Rotaria sordida TaxID=392033 RepID=A0A815G0J1_9BILA|nr:unnamed protein product [Rotaria sordida]CAF1592290.1 unnamed protein product [Rotaria sordida]
MTAQDIEAVRVEYQELESRSPQNHQSSDESDYAEFDRYQNINARGAWDATAVRLTDPRRISNYINANEVNTTDKYDVFHYYFIGWPDFGVIKARKLLELIKFINNHRKDETATLEKTQQNSLIPTVVHCSGGVGRTGTYIAVDIIMRLIDQSKDNLSQMKLDVMGIVDRLRQDRGKMVQTLDQYLLVNFCVKKYLQLTNQINNGK